MDKKIIQDAAVQLAEYITKTYPQIRENNTLAYYFSGSLAMNLISASSSLKQQHLDINGEIISDSEDIQISEEAKALFEEGVRTISYDIDTVAIDENVFDRCTKLDLTVVRRECDKAVVLCPAWKTFSGTMYLDALEAEKTIDSHNFAVLTLEDDKKIVIADPTHLLMHKLNEFFVIESVKRRGVSAESVQAKLDKNIRDFSCLFNGIAEMKMLPTDMMAFLSDFFSKTSNYMSTAICSDEHELIKNICKMIKPNISEKHSEQFSTFFKTISKFNQQQAEKNNSLTQ